MIRTMVASWYSSQNEEEKKSFRDFLNRELRRGVVEVFFIKKDGTERKMKCTLQEGIVVPYEKKTDKVKEPSTDICPVFDVEKQEWRSFKYESVIKLSATL